MKQNKISPKSIYKTIVFNINQISKVSYARSDKKRSEKLRRRSLSGYLKSKRFPFCKYSWSTCHRIRVAYSTRVFGIMIINWKERGRWWEQILFFRKTTGHSSTLFHPPREDVGNNKYRRGLLTTTHRPVVECEVE